MTRKERNAEIIRRVQAGENKADLADEFGLSEGTVTGICYAGGITGKEKHRERNRQIVERVQKGESTHAVAAELELGQPAVAHICRQAGINSRNERKKWEERQAQERRERNRQIAERISAGETLAGLAREFGLTRERVRQIGRNAGISVRAMKRERNAEIVERIRAGETTAAVARKFGLSTNHVTHICRQSGTSVHAMSQERERSKHRERDQEIVRRIKTGETQAALAREFGLPPHRVSRICREAGIRPRGRLNDKKQLQARNAEIVRRVKEGDPLAAVAKRFGLKPSYVDFICREAANRKKTQARQSK